MRRYRLAVLGGTFDHLHVGHQALLASAFRVGQQVAVGVTTDRFLADHPKPSAGRIQRYATRREALVRWLRRTYPRRTWRVTPLNNPFGGSLGADVDVLVVSRETERGGRAVNRERRRLGRPPVTIVSVPLVLADDLEPVSSRRVRAGEIGTDGRRLAPIRVRLSTVDPRDRSAARRAVTALYPRARFVEAESSHRPTPGPRTELPRRSRGTPAEDLTIRVARRGAGGWTAGLSTPRVRLRPRAISGSRPIELERGLSRLLRPRL